ncbi:hypothetical protein AXR71_15165, partial [Salmonella enterica subsp. enterica serovar Typhimurium]|nr:hypothetical protein [Salmonella enterica subsp. enterica serovar Typhimurium]
MKKFLRIKTWFVRLFSPDKKTLGAIGEDLRKVAVTAIGVGIVGVVSENGIGTVAKLAMRQPFVLFKGLTFQKLCLPGAFRPGD